MNHPVEKIKEPQYILKLFVSTNATSSHRAIRNLIAVLDDKLGGRYQLEVVDVQKEPLLAQSENITALPLLIKTIPLPCKRLVGDMSDQTKVIAGLNLLPA